MTTVLKTCYSVRQLDYWLHVPYYLHLKVYEIVRKIYMKLHLKLTTRFTVKENIARTPALTLEAIQ